MLRVAPALSPTSFVRRGTEESMQPAQASRMAGDVVEVHAAPKGVHAADSGALLVRPCCRLLVSTCGLQGMSPRHWHARVRKLTSNGQGIPVHCLDVYWLLLEYSLFITLLYLP